MNKRKTLTKSEALIPDFSHPEVRKKGKNYFKFFLKIFLSVMLITFILCFLFSYELFNIKHHSVTGVIYTDSVKINALAKNIYGKNIFLASKFILAYNCRHINEVQSVQIKKKLPNTILIKVKEYTPACCFSTDSGKYLVDSDGYVFHKLKDNEKTVSIPVIIHKKNNIILGANVNDITDFQTEFLYDLARTSYKNHLNIAKIEILNRYQVIMYTENGILIKFGPTADIVDKCYLLKQIYSKKKSILNKIKEIYILDSKTATYKLKS